MLTALNIIDMYLIPFAFGATVFFWIAALFSKNTWITGGQKWWTLIFFLTMWVGLMLHLIGCE